MPSLAVISYGTVRPKCANSIPANEMTSIGFEATNQVR